MLGVGHEASETPCDGDDIPPALALLVCGWLAPGGFVVGVRFPVLSLFCPWGDRLCGRVELISASAGRVDRVYGALGIPDLMQFGLIGSAGRAVPMTWGLFAV